MIKNKPKNKKKPVAVSTFYNIF